MFNFIYCTGFIGLFCLALVVLDFIMTTFLYVIYKLDNGKLNMIEYFKRMI